MGHYAAQQGQYIGSNYAHNAGGCVGCGCLPAIEGSPVLCTFHPSYLLRTQALADKRRVWEDMLAVMEKLAMPISEKQRGFFLKS